VKELQLLGSLARWHDGEGATRVPLDKIAQHFLATSSIEILSESFDGGLDHERPARSRVSSIQQILSGSIDGFRLIGVQAYRNDSVVLLNAFLEAWSCTTPFRPLSNAVLHSRGLPSHHRDPFYPAPDKPPKIAKSS
jgi:hypothetical protein